jgi:hypothetical protein
MHASSLLWVIDTSDYDFYETSKEELAKVIAYEDFIGMPVLVYANKYVRYYQ